MLTSRTGSAPLQRNALGDTPPTPPSFSGAYRYSGAPSDHPEALAAGIPADTETWWRKMSPEKRQWWLEQLGGQGQSSAVRPNALAGDDVGYPYALDANR